MNFNKLGIIIRREYLNKVKKKSFLIITFGVPVLIALMYVLMIFIMLKAKDEVKTVAVADRSGIVMPMLEDSDLLHFIDMGPADPDSLKSRLPELGADIMLSISPLDSAARTVTASTYSAKPLGVEAVAKMESGINKAVERYRIDSYGIEGLDKILSEVKSNVTVTSYTVDDSGKESISQSEVYMIVSMLLAMGLYMFIALFCGMVMTSVIEEKSSRVVEVLVSSVKATELMFGKIIGVALVAMTQFLLWIILTIVIIAAVGGIWGLPGGADAAGAMASMAAVPEGMAVEAPTGLEAVVGTLGSLHYGRILLTFFLFFVFGYMLYASLFAAIGSAVENEADTQQLQLPVTIPLLIGFFIAFYAFKAPDSQLVFWGSMIPFTSPIVMLARIPYDVKMWELALSLLLLIATFIACAWMSAKIYKVGILMYGKKSNFKDLWKWLKQK